MEGEYFQQLYSLFDSKWILEQLLSVKKIFVVLFWFFVKKPFLYKKYSKVRRLGLWTFVKLISRTWGTLLFAQEQPLKRIDKNKILSLRCYVCITSLCVATAILNVSNVDNSDWQKDITFLLIKNCWINK